MLCNRHLVANRQMYYFHNLAVGFPLKEASIVLFVILNKWYIVVIITNIYKLTPSVQWVKASFLVPQPQLCHEWKHNLVYLLRRKSSQRLRISVEQSQIVWWVPDAVSKSLLPHLVTSSIMKVNHLIIWVRIASNWPAANAPTNQQHVEQQTEPGRNQVGNLFKV